MYVNVFCIRYNHSCLVFKGPDSPTIRTIIDSKFVKAQRWKGKGGTEETERDTCFPETEARRACPVSAGTEVFINSKVSSILHIIHDHS